MALCTIECGVCRGAEVSRKDGLGELLGLGNWICHRWIQVIQVGQEMCVLFREGDDHAIVIVLLVPLPMALCIVDVG